MILENKGSGDLAPMLKNVRTKFERNREREKDLERVHKNCMLSEPRCISQTQKKKKVNTRNGIVY